MKRKILLVTSEFPPGPGGIGEHAYRLAQALVSLSYRVMVLSPGDYASKDEIRHFDRKLPFDIIRYPRWGPGLTQLVRLWMTWKEIAWHSHRKVIVTGKFSLWQNLLFKNLYAHSIKTLAVVHGSEVRNVNPLIQWLTVSGIRSADRIVSVSQFTRDLLVQFGGLDKERIHVIPNGLAEEDLGPDTVQTLQGSPRLLTVGHVSPRKGQHLVIKALPEISRKYPQVHYHIVGIPYDRDKLEKLASDLGVGGRITFHGRVKSRLELSAYYRACDVFMLLSENQPNGDVEGFGIVALEANRFGKPVIGAKDTGVQDAVKEDRSGYLVDASNPSAISDALHHCLKNVERLSKSSKEWAVAHRWEYLVIRYNELLF